jgi:hypothetical protein
MIRKRDTLLQSSFQEGLVRIRRSAARSEFEREIDKHMCPQCGAKDWMSMQLRNYNGTEYGIECQQCWSASKLLCKVPWSPEAVVTVLFLNMVPGSLRVAERLMGVAEMSK